MHHFSKRLGKFLYMWIILCTFAAVLVYLKAGQVEFDTTF